MFFLKYYIGKKIFRRSDSNYIWEHSSNVKIISYIGNNGEEPFLKKIIANLEKFDNLEVLEISNCFIDIKSWEFEKLKKIKFFHFSNGKMEVPHMRNSSIECFRVDNGILNLKQVNFEKMYKLKYLYITDASFITDNIFESESVEFLYLLSNNITTISPNIIKLKKLRKLYLMHNPIDAVPDNLCKLKKLNFLNVSQTNITDIPPSLYKIKRLKLVVSGGCNSSIPSFSYDNMVKLLSNKPPGWKVLFTVF